MDVVGERAALDAWSAQRLTVLRAQQATAAGDSIPEWGDERPVAVVQAEVEAARASFVAAHRGAYPTDGRVLAILQGTPAVKVPVYRSFRANVEAKRQARQRVADAAAERGVPDPRTWAADVIAGMGSGPAQSKRAIDELVNDGRLEELLPEPAGPVLTAVTDDAGSSDRTQLSRAARHARLVADLLLRHGPSVARLALATGWERQFAARTLADVVAEWADEHPGATRASSDAVVPELVDLILSPEAQPLAAAA